MLLLEFLSYRAARKMTLMTFSAPGMQRALDDLQLPAQARFSHLLSHRAADVTVSSTLSSGRVGE